MEFREIKAEELNGNTFEMIGKQWMLVTAKNSKVSKYAGLIIGFTLTLVHLIGIRFTGTSVNPARSIATAFADLFFSGNANALKHVWIFILAPLGGGALAALVYNLLNKKDDEASEDSSEEDNE